MIRRRTSTRRGFVVLTALAGLLVLLVVAALFLQFGIQGLRREHIQDLTAQGEQAAQSLRELSRRPGLQLGSEMREVPIADLLPAGASGTAWLGIEANPAGEKRARCRIEIERGRDRLTRSYEWPLR